MEIHSGSALSILMYYWPFILSGMASLFYYSRLSIGKLVLFFGIGVLAGEGVSAIMLMSISVLLMPLASVYLEHRAVATLVFAVLYAGSALITACVLWVLGKSLCGRARTSLHIPLDAPTIGAPVNAHSDSTGMSQIDFSITEQNYLHSLWLHHNLNTWRISGVIVVTILVGIFAHMAAKFSVSASAGGVIGYITWYLAYYFIVLRYRCEKLYRQQKSLHLPVKVIWSNEPKSRS